jgi:hypothetical protein
MQWGGLMPLIKEYGNLTLTSYIFHTSTPITQYDVKWKHVWYTITKTKIGFDPIVIIVRGVGSACNKVASLSWNLWRIYIMV